MVSHSYRSQSGTRVPNSDTESPPFSWQAAQFDRRSPTKAKVMFEPLDRPIQLLRLGPDTGVDRDRPRAPPTGTTGAVTIHLS